ncbi:class I SAM-dependent methyltransferase [Fictibacillus sp. NRS-1165]|uniref:class I SAM-dependent methyltransferase n=1 Tax=Fictibacillus sp. NRS-1165 TaxID=3144463 RepID=UPI003D2501BB
MDERRFNIKKKALLDSPERRKLLPPEKLLSLLSIKSNDSILDLGAGTGYFTIPASIMTQGDVYALDLEKELLDVIQSQIEEQNISNIHLIQGKAQAIPLASSSIDIVIASLILHAVEPLSKGICEIYRVMKQGAYLLCFEWEKKESPMGPPIHIRIPSEEMEALFLEKSFKIIKKVFPTDFLYIYIIQKM